MRITLDVVCAVVAVNFSVWPAVIRFVREVSVPLYFLFYYFSVEGTYFPFSVLFVILSLSYLILLNV